MTSIFLIFKARIRSWARQDKCKQAQCSGLGARYQFYEVSCKPFKSKMLAETRSRTKNLAKNKFAHPAVIFPGHEQQPEGIAVANGACSFPDAVPGGGGVDAPSDS